MNQKLAVWKRKLAKEKWKNQKAVWEKLQAPAPVTQFEFDFKVIKYRITPKVHYKPTFFKRIKKLILGF